MPTDYRCNSCRLTFSMGWYHFHDFSKGYGSAELVVCTSCGTQHRIMIAIRERGEEFLLGYDVLVTAIPPTRKIEAMATVRREFRVSLAQAKEIVSQLPLRVAQNLSERHARERARPFEELGATTTLVLASRTPNPNYRRSLQQDCLMAAQCPAFSPEGDRARTERRLAVVGETSGATAHFNLAMQSCGYCGAVGTLLGGNGPALSRCPHCGGGPPEATTVWIT